MFFSDIIIKLFYFILTTAKFHLKVLPFAPVTIKIISHSKRANQNRKAKPNLRKPRALPAATQTPNSSRETTTPSVTLCSWVARQSAPAIRLRSGPARRAGLSRDVNWRWQDLFDVSYNFTL